jgi:hypothetical protein
MSDRDKLLHALRVWIAQRPGLEYDNYGDPTSYRSEARRIGQQLSDARIMLAAIERRQSLTYADLVAAIHNGFSGRLTWDGENLDYCTGQYWPTEYRAAVCAGLALSLWRFWRECGSTPRIAANREFGRGLASRWFA